MGGGVGQSSALLGGWVMEQAALRTLHAGAAQGTGAGGRVAPGLAALVQ